MKKPGEEASRESGAVLPNEHLSSDDLAGVVEALTGERVTPRAATGHPAGATRRAAKKLSGGPGGKSALIHLVQYRRVCPDLAHLPPIGDF
jgi:hypothetical protein